MRYLWTVMPAIFATVVVGCDRGGTSSGSGSASATSKPEGRAIIEAAITAHGLAAYREMRAGEIRIFTRGYLTAEKQDEITAVSAFQLHDRLQERRTHGIRGGTSDKLTESVYVRFGEQAWTQVDGQGFKPDEVEPISMLYPLQVIHQLLTFRQDTELVRLDDQTAQGKPATWVEVTQGDLTGKFAFDPSTHLLIGSSMPAYNHRTGKEGVAETWYSDFRQYGGMTLPAKSVGYLDGEIFVERTVLDFNTLPKIDDAKLLKVLSRDEVKPIVESAPNSQEPAPAP
jgi:hypothetical protein